MQIFAIQMKKISDFLKSLSIREIVLIVISVFLIIICTATYLSKNSEIRTVKIENGIFKNKVDEQYNAQTVLIQTNKELKKAKDSISLEYEKIKDQEPIFISNTTYKIVRDTIKAETEIVKVFPNEYRFNWKYSENYNPQSYFSINGHTTSDSLFTESETWIERLEIGADLTLDIITPEQSKDKVEIIARSSNPYLKISNIQGTFINPTENKTIKSFFPKKHWGVGIYGGYGIGINTSNRTFTTGPQIGIGVSYNILTW